MSEARYLIIRFSAIGDCVMSAWAATAIRNKHPHAFICWAVEPRCAAVIDRKHLVTQAAEAPQDRWKRQRWSPATWSQMLGYYARLRRLRFDFGVDLQGHSKTAICLRLAKPKRRIAARAIDPVAMRLNPVFGVMPEAMHTVEWNHEVLHHFGDFTLPIRPIMPIRDSSWEAVRAQLPKGRLASISVSAGHPSKVYPAQSWREVALALKQDGFEVVFLGGPNDTPIDVPGTTDLVRKLPLDQTMAVVAHSALHLAGDTGTGHMAAAYGVPVVSIFGSTNPDTYRPFTEMGIVLREGKVTENVASEWVVQAARELDRRARAALPH